MTILKYVLAAAIGLALLHAEAAGPFATKAKVVVEVQSGELPLKLEEKVAFMFVAAIKSLQDDCRRHAGHACTIEELVAGPKSTDNWPISKLKFDPARTDPNYTYKIVAKAKDWELWATPRKPGFGGFHAAGGMISKAYYNPKGEAGAADQKITGHSIDGDLFSVSQ
jgi:hypothetical protein